MFGYVQLRTVRFKKGGRKEGNTVTGSWIAYLSVELDRKRREIKGHLYPLYPRYLRDSIRSLSDIRVSFTSLNIFQSFFSPLSLSLFFSFASLFFSRSNTERTNAKLGDRRSLLKAMKRNLERGGLYPSIVCSHQQTNYYYQLPLGLPQ